MEEVLRQLIEGKKVRKEVEDAEKRGKHLLRDIEFVFVEMAKLCGLTNLVQLMQVFGERDCGLNSFQVAKYERIMFIDLLLTFLFNVRGSIHY
jgi:hypothetical protein